MTVSALIYVDSLLAPIFCLETFITTVAAPVERDSYLVYITWILHLSAIRQSSIFMTLLPPKEAWTFLAGAAMKRSAAWNDSDIQPSASTLFESKLGHTGVPVAGLSSTRNLQSCKCRVLRGPQYCVYVTDGYTMSNRTIWSCQGSLHNLSSCHMMAVVELGGKHDVVADDYVLTLPQASLFEAQDLNWCLCCWSWSRGSSSRQNFHFVTHLWDNKGSHRFYWSWASSLFTRQGRALAKVSCSRHDGCHSCVLANVECSE